MSWRKVQLREFLDNDGIDIQTGPFGTQLKASDYTTEGTPVINVRNVGYGDLREDKLEFVPDQVSSRLCVHILQSRDIVFGRKGAVDRHLLVTESEVGWMQGSDCIRLRIKTDEINPQFLSYALRLPTHKQWMITQCSNKATMASLNHDVISRIPIFLPGLRTQDRIASILSAYDDLIENNRRRIQLLEQAARLLYKEWFVHLRFPGHEHVNIKDGVPEGWEKKQVKDLLAKVKRPGKIQKADYLSDGPIPCIDQSREFIGGSTDQREAMIDEIPMIVFGDHTRVLKFIDFPFACGADGTQLLAANDPKISQEFFFFSLDAIDLSNYFYARHFKFLKDQHILRPTDVLIDQFTGVARPIMKQVKILREQNGELAKARDLLLPKLMNGEVAV